MSKLQPVRIVVEFVVVDNDIDKMNLKWKCDKFFKQGILDEIKCEQVKKEIFKWIKWASKDSFDERDLM